MMTKIYAVVATAFAVLFGWLKITQAQRDRARIESDKQSQARMAEQAKFKQAVTIAKARVQANDEAKQVKPSNTHGERPTGSFGDKRL